MSRGRKAKEVDFVIVQLNQQGVGGSRSKLTLDNTPSAKCITEVEKFSSIYDIDYNNDNIKINRGGEGFHKIMAHIECQIGATSTVTTTVQFSWDRNDLIITENMGYVTFPAYDGNSYKFTLEFTAIHYMKEGEYIDLNGDCFIGGTSVTVLNQSFIYIERLK